MSAREDIERLVAGRLLRLPVRVMRHTGARRPVVLDGQRLDTQSQFMLWVLEQARRPALCELPVAQARLEYRRMPLLFEDPPLPLPRVRDAALPGPGRDLSIRIYDPRGAARPLPTLVFFHGGGGVVGDLDTHDGVCRQLALSSGCLVVSVDYRLAPESPFPAALDDAVASFRWVHDNAEHLGVDPGRIAMGGDSFGGYVTAAACHALCRDDPGPRLQLLIYPSTDQTYERGSRQLFADGFFLTDAMIRWFGDHYFGDTDRTDPRASPLRATDLSGLPPAVVATAGFDPLRDEGRDYAAALEAAGVDVEHICFEDQLHGFVQITGVVDGARQAVRRLGHRLRDALS